MSGYGSRLKKQNPTNRAKYARTNDAHKYDVSINDVASG